MTINSLCIRCRGRGYCGSYCKILYKIKSSQPKIEKNFSGSSPPEIFVGKHDYPHVFAGILAPNEIGNTERISSPEYWYKDKLDIEDILKNRASMIYSRFSLGIKDTLKNKNVKNKNFNFIDLEKLDDSKVNPPLSAISNTPLKFIDLLQDVAIASKSLETNFDLKNTPRKTFSLSSHTPLIGNPASLKKAKIESNIKVEKKVDYLVNDTDSKAVNSVKELFNSGINVSSIIKVFSAGLLGLKKQRRLVPTRWSITAVDDSLSKEFISKIRYYPWVSEIMLFNGNYLGNYYEILLLPGEWGFEVIEASPKGGLWNKESIAFWQDYEFFSGRKTYAESVTGGYYAVRLPITEYLSKIKKQATIIVFRESREEYWAPCGVGILRELVKGSLLNNPETFSNIEEAFSKMQTRFTLPISFFKEKSVLLKRKKEQRKIFDF